MSMKDHQNPDGTYNGITALSELSGLSEETMKDIWAKVQDNNRALDACPSHDFEPNPDGNRTAAYRCKNCGGTVTDNNYRWHELGRRSRK